MNQNETAVKDALLEVLMEHDGGRYSKVKSVDLRNEYGGLSSVRKFKAIVKTTRREFFRIRLFDGETAAEKAERERNFWSEASKSASGSIYPEVIAPGFTPAVPMLVYRDVQESNPGEDVYSLDERIDQLCMAEDSLQHSEDGTGTASFRRKEANSNDSTKAERELFLRELSRFVKLHTTFCLEREGNFAPLSELVRGGGLFTLPDATLQNHDIEWILMDLMIDGIRRHSLVGTPCGADVLPKAATELKSDDVTSILEESKSSASGEYWGIVTSMRGCSTSYMTTDKRFEFSLPGGRVIWIWMPGNDAQFDPALMEKVEAIVIHKKLAPRVVSIRDALEKIGFTEYANLRAAIEAFAATPLMGRPIAQRTACHGDLHVRNILSVGHAFMAIDLGQFETGNAASDIARLELSLWDFLGDRNEDVYNGGSTHAVLKACQSEDPSRLSGVERVLFDVVTRLRSATFEALREHVQLDNEAWRLQHAFASLEAIRDYQTYYLGRIDVKASAALSAATAFWREHVTAICQAAPQSAVGDGQNRISPVDDTVAELLHVCLSRDPASPEGRTLSPEANDLFRDIALHSGETLNRVLTPLARTVKEMCLTGDSPFHHDERHVLIAAPTGAGKSFLAELFLLRGAYVDEGQSGMRKSVYIAPTKALAQEKYHDLMHRVSPNFQKGIILSTGDDRGSDGRLVSGAFRIAFTVYEKASMLLSRSAHLLNTLQSLIVDELHMLDELHRGPVLDLVLTKVLKARDEQLYHRLVDSPRLRVIALTTEGSVQDELMDFLRVPTEDPDNPSPPILIRTSDRPVPVKHTIVLPDIKPGTFRLEDIKTIYDSQDRILTKEEESRLESVLFSASKQVGGERKDLGTPNKQRAEMTKVLMSCLAARIAERSSDGYRALVFLPSISKVEEAAARFCSQRLAPENSLASEEMQKAIRQADNYRTAEDCVKWARRGAFIHHSDVDREIRRFIESRFRNPASHGEVEVLFCTETLSYGVNLAVDEVFLFGVRFLNADRAALDVSPVLLTPCEYHNMAGRAGRLGAIRDQADKREFRVFTIAQPDLDPYRQVIRPFYTEEGAILGRLFVSDDYQAQQRLDKLALRELPFSGHAEMFSPPFVRCIIDVVRHIGYLRRSSGENHPNIVPGSEVEDFIERTYGKIFLEKNNPRFAELLPQAVSSVLEDVSLDGDNDQGTEQQLKVGLLTKTQRGGAVMYKVTELGETFVDTGADIRIVKPLQKLLPELYGCWRKFRGNAPMPAELVVLAACAQRDVLGKVAKTTTEYRHSGLMHEKWAENLVQVNRDHVNASFSNCAKDWLDGDLIAGDRFMREIRRVLIHWVHYSFDFSIMKSPWSLDEELTVDITLRLVNGLMAWISGQQRTKVDHLLEQSNAQPNATAKFKGWQNFVEQLQYKVMFVAKVMASIDRQTGGDMSAIIERRRELFVMSERVRHGCRADTLPLAAVRLRGDRKVNRDTKNILVENGVTPSRIVSTRASRLVKNVPTLPNHNEHNEKVVDEDQLRELSVKLIDYYDGLGTNLRDHLVGGWPDRTDQDVWVVNTWTLLTDAFKNTFHSYFRHSGVESLDEEILRGLSPWRFMGARAPESFSEPDEDTDVREDTRHVAVERCRDGGGGFYVTYFVEDSEVRRTRFIIRNIRDDGSFLSAGERRLSFAESVAPYRDEHLAIVTLPWMPLWEKDDARQRPIDAEIRRRQQRDLTTCFVSASAWGVSFATLARGFLGAQSFADLWSSTKSRNVSVEVVAKSLESGPGNASSLPETLWESIFAMREVT